MTSSTDAVLKGAVTQWIAELPAAERDTLLAELATLNQTDTPPERNI